MGLKSDESIKEFTHKYSKVCVDNNAIEPDLFDEYGVKRGLRDKNGKGVLSGLTNISLIKSSEEIDGKSVPCDGQLYYRGCHYESAKPRYYELLDKECADAGFL